MEEMVAKQHFIEQLTFIAICTPLSTLMGVVLGRVSYAFIVYSEGLLQYIARIISLLFIISGVLYLVLEWTYLSFEWAVLWGTFIVPIIAIYLHALSVTNSEEFKEET